MNLLCRCGIAALLLCTSGLASAETGAPLRISDDLVLTGAQEDLIWRRVGGQHTPEARTPTQFEASIYGTVPSSIGLHAFPAEITERIPTVKPYLYATVGKLLLIVNPTNQTIVDIIWP